VVYGARSRLLSSAKGCRMALKEEIEEARRRNIVDVIRHARWEAEMVKKMGDKWFEARDEWLRKALEADLELLEKSPQIKRALIKALETRDKIQQRKRAS